MGGAGDLQRGRVLKEDDGAKFVVAPVRLERKLRAGCELAGGGLTDSAEVAHHGGVAEQAAVILAAADLGAQIRFRDGEQDIERVRACVSDVDFDHVSGSSDRDTRLGVTAVGGAGDGLGGACGVVADELGAAVDDHLRGVHRAEVEACSVAALTLGVVRGGEAVFPSQFVPVIDMFTESDDLGAGDGLAQIELHQKSVGGRATGAALGSKQFHQDGDPVKLRAGLDAASQDVRQQQDSADEDGPAHRDEMRRREKSYVARSG